MELSGRTRTRSSALGQAATRDRGLRRSVATPSAARTSELPEEPDAARLPCLTTGTPQAATTIAAAVEIFTVPAPSPPVPHVSRSGSPSPSALPADHAFTDRGDGPFELVGGLTFDSKGRQKGGDEDLRHSPSSSAAKTRHGSRTAERPLPADQRLEGRCQVVHHGNRTLCCSITPLTMPVQTDDRLDVIGPLVQDLDGLLG